MSSIRGHVEKFTRATMIVAMLIGPLLYAPARPSHAQAQGSAPMVPTEAQMKAQMYAYIRAMNAGDEDAIVALFADNATLEDPVGTPLKVGKAAIEEFFIRGTSRGIGMDLVGQPVTSRTNSAAMALKVHIGIQTENGATLNVIDVFTFTPEGKFLSMKAYFGSDDREPLSPTRR